MEVDNAELVGFYEAIKSVIYNLPCIYAAVPLEDYFVSYLSYYVEGNINTEIPLTTYEDTIATLSNYMPDWNDVLFNIAQMNQRVLFDSANTHSTEYIDSYYIVGTGNQTVSEVRLGSKQGENVVSECEAIYTLLGDNTVTLRSATAADTFSQKRIFYKTNDGVFKSGHVAMIEGVVDEEGDDTTIGFICDIISMSHNYIINANQDTWLANHGIMRGE